MRDGDKIDPGACSIACNLCGQKNVFQLSLKDRHGRYLRTVICRACGLIWSDPRPSEDDLKDFYATKYRQEYKGIYKPKTKHIHRDAVEAVKRYLFLKKIIKAGDKVLDVGSGSGVFVYTLAKLGFDAAGLEPDQDHSDFARDILHIDVTTGFIQDMDPKPCYDMVTLHHVLEHFSDPFQNLKTVWAILKPEGYLMVEVPNAQDIRQDPKNRYHKAHLYTFNPETLEEILKKAGFGLVKRKVAPLNGNITFMARKLGSFPEISGIIPGNFESIKKNLEIHTSLRHFTRLTPYQKIAAHFFRAVGEQIAILGKNDPVHLIDQVIARHMN